VSSLALAASVTALEVASLAVGNVRETVGGVLSAAVYVTYAETFPPPVFDHELTVEGHVQHTCDL